MSWRVMVRDVRRRDGLLRWTLIACTADVETLVVVDTTERGTVVDLQSDEYCSTTGDLELDDLCCECVRREVVSRHVSQSLDELDRRRWGRVQMPHDRRWAA